MSELARTLPLMGAIVAAALLALLVQHGSPALYEAWLAAFLLLAGFGVGSLGLLMIGHLLGEHWLKPVRAELEAAARTLPLVALLGLPLLMGLETLFVWAADPAVRDALPAPRAAYLEEGFFLLRSAVYLAVWSLLALLIAREGRHRALSALGLVVMALTTSLAAVDWIMSREPAWWSSMFGLATSISQLLGALALALLVAIIRPGHPGMSRERAVMQALMTLAMLTAWIWFAQFLIVWSANLPAEAAWYLRRQGLWLGLEVGLVVPALLTGLFLLVPPQPHRWRVLAAAILLLVQHVAHLYWVVRPAALEPALSWLDPAVVLGLGLPWLAAFLHGLRHRPGLVAYGEALP